VVRANSAGSAYEYLINLIGGIILIGTPHQGSKSQKWGAILARLAHLVECGETVLMDDVDEKSMKIFDMVEEFMQIMIRTDLAKTKATVCFYENRPTNYVERKVKVGGWIRDQTSAMVRECSGSDRHLTTIGGGRNVRGASRPSQSGLRFRPSEIKQICQCGRRQLRVSVIKSVPDRRPSASADPESPKRSVEHIAAFWVLDLADQ